jgi:competence protein ComFB
MATRLIDFTSMENYYVRLVVQHVTAEHGNSPLAEQPGALEDVACLALNQLPPRYVRHSIDTAFYLSVEEQQDMIRAVKLAVDRAVRFVEDHPRLPLTGELPHGELIG